MTESLEPVGNVRLSVTSSSSVNMLDSLSSSVVVVARCMTVGLDGPASPDGLFGAVS